jgi:hypothetical protein
MGDGALTMAVQAAADASRRQIRVIRQFVEVQETAFQESFDMQGKTQAARNVH